TMDLTLRIWRQQHANTPGKFVTYHVHDVTPDMSFLERLDALNEDLLNREEPPVAFEHDCREGICGSCGFPINGVGHGGPRGTTVCHLSMRFSEDGDTLTLEPWRAHGKRPRRECHPGPKGGGGYGVRRGCVHRQWGVRRGLPECRRHAVHLSQNYAPQLAAAGSAPARPEDPQHGGRHGERRVRQLHESWRM